MNKKIKKLLAENNGKLPSYAWPGGYTLNYYTRDGGMLCAKCAQMAINEGLTEDPQWDIVELDVYWEGPTMQCDHCNAAMEAEYGDPEDK